MLECPVMMHSNMSGFANLFSTSVSNHLLVYDMLDGFP